MQFENKILIFLNIIEYIKIMEKNENLEKEKNEKDNGVFEEENESDNEVIKGFKNEPEEYKIEKVKDNIKTYDKSIKIILIGDCKVGKTSILHRLTDNKFNEKYKPSLTLEYSNYTIKINNYIMRMQIWDTSGQEKYESGSIISNYYKTAEVAVFVYAINDQKSFINIKEYIKDLINENEEQNNIKKVLLGNKLDLGGERKVDFNSVKKFSEINKFDKFSEITCKIEDSNNIRNIFNSIGCMFYEEYSRISYSSNLHYSVPSSLTESRVESDERDNDEGKKCCIICNIF